MIKTKFAENPFRFVNPPKIMVWHHVKDSGEPTRPTAQLANPGLAKSLSSACLITHHSPNEDANRKESYFFKRFDGKIRITRPHGWLN